MRGCAVPWCRPAPTAQDVLVAAGIDDLFEARIDGVVARREHLHGKPAPDTYLAGAKALGVTPAEAAVFEDALAGVEAGRAGHFGYVVGVDRVGAGAALKAHGADIVVEDLAELLGPAGDPAVDLHGRAVGLAGEQAGPRICSPRRSRCSRCRTGTSGWRGNLDEGEPHGLPGTYLNGVFALRPLPYAEAGYGFPESGQTVINVTNGKIIRLYVDDEPFDIRYGQLRSHERVLDFRTGLLTRTVEWVSPAGQSVRVTSTRLVSLTQRAIGAISYQVEPLDGPARISVQSELVANEQLPASGGDPRVSAVLENPLHCEFHADHGTRVVVVHTTGESGLRVGAAMEHEIDGSSGVKVQVDPRPTPMAGWSRPRRCSSRASGCTWSSTWPTAGRARGPCLPSATRCGRR